MPPTVELEYTEIGERYGAAGENTISPARGSPCPENCESQKSILNLQRRADAEVMTGSWRGGDLWFFAHRDVLHRLHPTAQAGHAPHLRPPQFTIGRLQIGYILAPPCHAKTDNLAAHRTTFAYRLNLDTKIRQPIDFKHRRLNDALKEVSPPWRMDLCRRT